MPQLRSNRSTRRALGFCAIAIAMLVPAACGGSEVSLADARAASQAMNGAGTHD